MNPPPLISSLRGICANGAAGPIPAGCLRRWPGACASWMCVARPPPLIATRLDLDHFRLEIEPALVSSRPTLGTGPLLRASV